MTSGARRAEIPATAPPGRVSVVVAVAVTTALVVITTVVVSVVVLTLIVVVIRWSARVLRA